MANQIQEQEIDLSVLWSGVRRYWQWILLSAILFGLISYAWSVRQPKVYEATSNLMAANRATVQEAAFGGASVQAPPLPEGALSHALKSPQVMQSIMQAVKKSSKISDLEKERLLENLQNELSSQKLQTIGLGARLDSGGNGIYTIRTKARTAEAARVLANLSAKALRDWDRNRALETIRRAQSGFKAQLDNIEKQLVDAKSVTEKDTLNARRISIQTNLTQVNILETSLNPVLSKLSDAVKPLEPIKPKPIRTAVLSAVIGFLLSAGIIALFTVFDRTIRSEEDLVELGFSTLGVIPKLRQRETAAKGIIRAARQDGLYEALGFLRVNLMTLLQEKANPIIVLSSTAPGEGKSSLTATLADGFAATGRRVLIIDADLRRGTQELVWKKFNEERQWWQMTGEGGARNTREALRDPTNVQVAQTAENIYLLPAGQSIQDSLGILNHNDISKALKLWRPLYDVILIDSAPVLSLADALVLGTHADGMVMVVEYGRTNLNNIKRALRKTEQADLKMLGFVLNKVDMKEEANQIYTYNYTSKKMRTVK